MKKIGKPVVFNICVLGSLIGVAGILQPQSVMAAIGDRVPRDFLEMKNRAFDLGLVLGTRYR
ncbi:MAG: hypothetical protein V1793_25305 [Pseudomonadota bacterium]